MASIEQKMRKAAEIQQEIMVAAAGDYTDDEGYQTADDGDFDDADRDASRAAHVLSTLIDDRIPADEIEEKLSRLSCLAISLGALDHTEHCEVVLGLVNEMCVLMDTCATRSIQGDFKSIVWSKKLRVPVSVAQGSQDAEASAEYIGVRETFHVAPGTNIAMGKQDLTLISTSFRKGLYIEGMTPTYNRGLGTGPTCDYLYNMNAHCPQKNYNDASPEFKAQSVPLKKLRNGLPYSLVIGKDSAIAQGYQLIDFITLQSYDSDEAMQSLLRDMGTHKDESYFIDAMLMLSSSKSPDEWGSVAHGTTKSPACSFPPRQVNPVNTVSSPKRSSKFVHSALPTVQTNDDDFFDCNDEPLHVHFEDVLEAETPDPYFSANFEVFHSAQDTVDTPSSQFSSKASKTPEASSLRKLAASVGSMLTLVSLCYGITSESLMQHSSLSVEDRLPFQVVGGCESNPTLRARFEELNPNAVSHSDMFTLVDDISSDDSVREKFRSDIVMITTPCINKTVLKDYNLSDYNPDDRLFDVQVKYVKAMLPEIVLGEMTPPHELCHDDHKRVANSLREIGYDATVTDRMPSDLCGDLTHRDRWFMVARLHPVGQLNISDWADKPCRPCTTILDPIGDVDSRLWIDGEIEPWEEWRRGSRKPLNEITSSDVGKFITHSFRAGHLKGHMSEKGTKVTDPELGPLPTTTRFANGIIIDRRRNNDQTQLRSLSFSEYARAASLPASQIEWMRSMDPNTGFDGGPNSFAALAGAIPRNTLHTMLRICCYETLKAKTTTSSHSISGLSVSDDNFVGVHSHDVSPSSPQSNLFDLPESDYATDRTDNESDSLFASLISQRHDERQSQTTLRLTRGNNVLPALFFTHCLLCSHACKAPTCRHAAYTTNDVNWLAALLHDDDNRDSVFSTDVTEPSESEGGTLDAGTVSKATHGIELPLTISARTKVTRLSKSDWPPLYSPDTAEYRNAVDRAAKYHNIFHHSPEHMEKNISIGLGHGCKPGDSRYVPECGVCLRTGLDRVPRHHTSREVSTRTDKTLPGEKWMLDGNDTTVYDLWGNYRSTINFVDSVSFYRISVPVRTANAAEFLDALRYVVNFTRMTTGNNAKAFYSDYATSYMSDRVTDYLAHNKIQLEVVPPYVHHLNGHAEEMVHSQTKGMRVRLPSLKGVDVKGVPVRDYERYWVFANEHMIQCHNNSNYSSLERLHGHPITPRQAFFSDPGIKPVPIRAFGELCYVIMQKDKRQHKLHDTAERCRYLFNSGFNPISNVLVDCPRAHVVLRPNGEICVTSRIVFPHDKLPDSRSAAPHEPTPTSSSDDTAADITNRRDDEPDETSPSGSEHIRTERLRSTVLRDRAGDMDSSFDAAPTNSAPAPTSTTTRTAAAISSSPSQHTPVAVSTPSGVSDDDVLDTSTPSVPHQTTIVPASVAGGASSSGGASSRVNTVSPPTQEMPKADFFVGKSFPIRWDPAKAKRPGSLSGEQYQVYSKSSTIGEMMAQGGRRHFDNDVRRGIFSFTESPWRDLQHRLQTDHVDEVRAQRTRIRSHVHVSDHGGVSTSNSNSMPLSHQEQHEQLYHLLDTCDFSVLNKFDEKLHAANADILRICVGDYRSVEQEFTSVFGLDSHTKENKYCHKLPFTDVDGNCSIDPNETLDDMVSFWLTDDSVSEIVLRLETRKGIDDVPLNKHSSSRHNREGAPAPSYILKPEDIQVDEFVLPALRDYVGDDREQMKQAVIKEMRDLCSLGTLCWEKIPDNRRAISSKVVLKLKYKADGTPDKHKGRLVARGFESKPGVDFFGTFAPMANLTTVRTLFAIAVHTIGSDGKSLPIIQADIPQAFLQAEIDVPQYIMLPKGITVNPVYTALDTADWDNRIVRLLRSLYGLKSAPQIWNKMLNEILVDDLKLKRAASDSCLYHYRDDDGWILLCTEVDDLVITGTNEKKIESIRQYLFKRFEKSGMKDWGPIKSFLGINIAYDREAGRLEMDVADKIKKLFEQHPILWRARPKRTPLPPDGPLPTNYVYSSEERNYLRAYLTEHYASIVGALIYSCITCRPDIAFAIGRTSRGMHNPTEEHVRQLEHLVGYMRNFPHLKLIYHRGGSAVADHLSHLSEKDTALTSLSSKRFRDGNSDPMDPAFGMSDSDYAGSATPGRKSISGYCFFVFCNLVTWKSKLQPLTAGSTHEAELISMSFAADEAVWIRRLLLEVGFAIPGVHHIRSRTDDDDDDVFPSVETQTESWIASMRPTWLLGDNQSAIFTAGNPETSQRSKHLEIRWFRIRDYIRDLTLRVRHIPTQHNIADFFTKSLQGMDSFDKHRQSLMGRQDFSPWKSIPESEA